MGFPDPDTYYTIQSVHSGKVFDVRDSSWDPDTPVVQFGLGGVGKTNQQFLVHEGSKPGHYRLIGRHSTLAVRIKNDSHDDRAPLVQSRSDQVPMDFELRRLGTSDLYQIIAVHSGKALFVDSKENGAPVMQIQPWEHPKVQFQFVHPVPRPETSSITAIFDRIFEPEDEETSGDDIVLMVWFVWTVNGQNQSSYRELRLRQSTRFDIPRGATNIGWEAKWSGAVASKALGTYRKNLELKLRVARFPAHVSYEDIERP